MEILMVAAELSPYARAGETADAVAALSRMLVQLGHEVTVALPRYASFEDQGLLVARRLTPLRLPSGDSVTVFDGQLGSGVKIALFDAPEFFSKPGVYGDGEQDFPDNARRFALLAQASAALAAQRAAQGQAFDVAHLHDWPGALAAIALAQADVPLPKVLTVHDLRRDGTFPSKELAALGINESLNTEAGVKLGSQISVLKGGVQMADVVTTVSPRFARDLATPTCGGLLAPVFEARGEELQGILPGLDYAIHNPTTDTALASRFNAENAANKGVCKTALVRRLELDFDVRRPLIVVLGPLSEERGAGLVLQAARRIIDQEASLVVAGPASGALAEAFNAKELKGRDNYAFVSNYDAAGERQLLAAADLLLALPQYDPSASLLRKAQRYGAAPVALARGAVCDAVVDCDVDLETGTGFLYSEPTPDEMVGAVSRAVAACGSLAWPRLTRRILRLDLSWESPARRYLKVYKNASA
ncbi:MAG TPA: glycogen/starch synthase [Polyangiaceae bacterium]|nr:glycogen/starch synthase [Polyangiaceae bacterium]